MNKKSAIEALSVIDVVVYGSTHAPVSAQQLIKLEKAANDLPVAVQSDSYASKKAEWICYLVRSSFLGSSPSPSSNRQEILAEAQNLSRYVERQADSS